MWLLVDDSKEEREAFARALSEGGEISVVSVSASRTRALLDRRELVAEGILMDVDLSNERGSRGSGLGLAQDVRTMQYRQLSPPFPIIRFSYRDRVARSIGQDSSSDDLFDLKIDKDELDVEAVRRVLAGVAEVYAGVGVDQEGLEALFRVSEEQWERWGSQDFFDELRVADRTYLMARKVIQALELPGMLIDENLLAARLGIDMESSEGWASLREALVVFRYDGVAAKCFSRWWARGLEEWWETLRTETPLAAMQIVERYGVLEGHFGGIRALEMPESSVGDRPWRRCEMTFATRGDFLPVDPAYGVRLRPREQLPDWVDPSYAALGEAYLRLEDPRLDRDDLDRLRKLVPGGAL